MIDDNSSTPIKRETAGQPPYEPTDKDRTTIEIMVAGGIPQENIARVIGIDKKTMYKYYREELDTSADKANAAIAKTLFQQAKDGNTSAAIWWTKARMGWKDTTVTEGTQKIELIERRIVDPANKNS